MEIIIEREEIINEINHIAQNLEKTKIELNILKHLKENLSEDLKEKEIIFKLAPEVLMSNRTKNFYFHVGSNIFVECDKVELEKLIEKKIMKKEKFLEENQKKLQELEKKLAKIEKQIQDMIQTNEGNLYPIS